MRTIETIITGCFESLPTIGKDELGDLLKQFIKTLFINGFRD